MDINFNKSTNITWKPDNTLEVASSNGHVSKITGVSFANYLLVKDNPKLLKLIVLIFEEGLLYCNRVTFSFCSVSVIVACLYQTVTLSNYQGSVVISVFVPHKM